MLLRVRTASSLLALAPALCALTAAGLLAASCARGAGSTTPVASLASSVPAAAAFASIRDAWADPDQTPATLRPMLERFLATYSTDGQVPLARAALALVAIEQGDFDA